MKILIYGLNYWPEPTGVGKYTGEMATWFAKAGHQVEVIASHPYYPNWKVSSEYKGRGFMTEIQEGVTVHRVPLYVPEPHKVNAKRRILLETTFAVSSMYWWFKRWFSRNQYDLIIAVCPPLQTALFPWLYCLLHKLPLIVHVQDLQVDVALRLGILKQNKLNMLLYRVENFFLKRATRVSTITEAMRKRIEAKGVESNRTILFPNWADIEHVKPLPRENDLRRSLGFLPEDVLVIYSGNMGNKQGLHLIIDAAERLTTNKGIKFLLIGDGTERTKLENDVLRRGLDNVTFSNLVPLDELPYLLATGDIHLVVQRAEAADLVMPSKLTNILAAGRACIATSSPGTELYQILANHKVGIVTPPDDLEAFVKALEELIKDSDKRTEMGERARKYAELYLEKEMILMRFENELKKLL